MKIEFSTSGASFHAPDEFNDQSLDRCFMSGQMEMIFQDICQDIKDGKTMGQLLDINGNIVGSWEL